MPLTQITPAHFASNKWNRGGTAGIAANAMKNIPMRCLAKEKPMSNETLLALKELEEEKDAACERALSQISYLESTLNEAQLEIKQLKSFLIDLRCYH